MVLDLNLNFTGIFSNCFKTRQKENNLDIQKITDFLGNITDDNEKLNIIADFLYSNTKYSVLFITHNRNVIIRRNFDAFKTAQYDLLTFPILDKNENLVGVLSIGNSKEIKRPEEFNGVLKILGNILRKM